ncbi:hypothetical protein [Rhizobium sp. ZX09]|uniref:hypothetical protein n=1 Tax=Rhizobium sp. ZX09 TaxID=2291939 RepID=UPI001A982553|nr:hypothetical protein [Rhizobium sp. ZX09]QSZ57211.1 hypothetical protein BTN45_08895 [Rhizobium sp. ZX09]
MKCKLAIALSVSLGSSIAHAEADARAIESCKAGGKAFTEVAACLPDADVAYKTLDAFSAIYPQEAQPLKDKCIELNAENIVGAATCVNQALKTSLDLKASLPKGQTLDDNLFAAVSDPELKSKLDAEIKKAQKLYPEKRLWGGNTYRAYK